MSYLIHYLDDYLTMGPPGSAVCQQNVNIFMSLCSELGISLASEKLEGPSTSLTFLGIILDSKQMKIWLPADKLNRIKQFLTTWLPRQKARKRQIPSLVGALYHDIKFIHPGRAFVACMYSSAAKLCKMHCITRLNIAFRSDLLWWNTFGRLGMASHPQASCCLIFLIFVCKLTLQDHGVLQQFYPLLVTVAMATRMAEC